MLLKRLEGDYKYSKKTTEANICHKKCDLYNRVSYYKSKTI